MSTYAAILVLSIYFSNTFILLSFLFPNVISFWKLFFLNLIKILCALPYLGICWRAFFSLGTQVLIYAAPAISLTPFSSFPRDLHHISYDCL